eukprot:scpid88673/ scgid27008/ 
MQASTTRDDVVTYEDVRVHHTQTPHHICAHFNRVQHDRTILPICPTSPHLKRLSDLLLSPAPLSTTAATDTGALWRSPYELFNARTVAQQPLIVSSFPAILRRRC